jgi:hypothetical protein
LLWKNCKKNKVLSHIYSAVLKHCQHGGAEGGVKNPEIFSDIVYEWFLSRLHNFAAAAAAAAAAAPSFAPPPPLYEQVSEGACLPSEKLNCLPLKL